MGQVSAIMEKAFDPRSIYTALQSQERRKEFDSLALTCLNFLQSCHCILQESAAQACIPSFFVSHGPLLPGGVSSRMPALMQALPDHPHRNLHAKLAPVPFTLIQCLFVLQALIGYSSSTSIVQIFIFNQN